MTKFAKKTYFTTSSIDRMVNSEPFLGDAKCLAQIPNDIFDAAIEKVEKETGFLGPRRLLQLIEAEVGDGAQAHAVANFLANFAALVGEPEFAEHLKEALTRLPPRRLADAERVTLLGRLDSLMRRKPALERQAKAERLARRTGHHLDELSIVCDLRPVFNDGRDKIEAVVPITTLRLIAHGYDEVKEVEVRLTEQELVELCEAADRAKKKLKALKEFAKVSHLEVAESPSTLIADEDA